MDTSVDGPGADGSPGDAARRVKETAQQALGKTKDVVGEKLDEGTEKVATSIEAAASTLRRAAEDVQEDQAWLGAALRRSADGLESASRSLAGGNFSAAAEDLSGFARRQPAVFLGASVALGFLLARIGKTAVETSRPAQTPVDADYMTPGA